MNRLIVLLGLGVLLPLVAYAQPASERASAPAAEPNVPYYAVKQGVVLYSQPDSSRPYLHLQLREPVDILGRDGRWFHVRTADGAEGYARRSDLSNVWIRVSKRSQTLYLYQGTQLIMQLPADFGQNVFADKEIRGNLTNPDHWRTPTGTFFIARKNPRSTYYKALVLNYPNVEDAERGLRNRYITQAEYDAIVQAEATISMPPMNTALGGWIEIHGDGTGARSNWTQGCVAIKNSDMDALWSRVHVGTPVLIEP